MFRNNLVLSRNTVYILSITHIKMGTPESDWKRWRRAMWVINIWGSGTEPSTQQPDSHWASPFRSTPLFIRQGSWGTSTHTCSRGRKDGWWNLSILSLWLLIHPNDSEAFKVVWKTGSNPLTCKTRKNLKCMRFLQAHGTNPKQKDRWPELSYPLPRMKKTLFGAFILFWFSTFEAFWGKKKDPEGNDFFCGISNNKSSLEQNGSKIIDGKHLGS